MTLLFGLCKLFPTANIHGSVYRGVRGLQYGDEADGIIPRFCLHRIRSHLNLLGKNRSQVRFGEAMHAGEFPIAVSSSLRPCIDIFALLEKCNMAVTESDLDPKVCLRNLTVCTVHNTYNLSYARTSNFASTIFQPYGKYHGNFI